MRADRMEEITRWFVLLGPFAILACDITVSHVWGYEATITAVVREWARKSVLPELFYLLGALLLYLHLFRGWL